MNKILFSSTLISLCFFSNIFSQVNFIQNNEILVFENTEDSNSLLNAWSGGMNFCQFSEIDLNLDGEKDIFIFDRSGKNGSRNGNKIIPMIYDQNINDYVFKPEYIDNFPGNSALNDWVLLVDYNQDGKEDIFTSMYNSIALFTNISDDTLAFEFTKILDSDAGFGPTNLYVSGVDLPAIADVDGDCDIDVLSFNPEGTHIYFHQNKSVELYNSCSTIDLYRTENCWGQFQENFTDNDLTLFLDENCQPPELNPLRVHAGSTLLALDLNPQQQLANNPENTMELLLGDISYSNIVMVLNGGTPEDALMVDQDANFPSYSTSVNLPLFPACFYLDVNKDGWKDLIVSPNGVNISENKDNCLYYKNITNETNEAFWEENGENMLQFEYNQNDFLIEKMIDVGSNSKPILYDLDNDGLLDLVIGNKGYYDEANYNSSLSFYKNTGTESVPKFTKYYEESINNDFGNLSLLGNITTIESIHPTFGDVDLDGDIDLVFGDSSGKIFIVLAINSETGSTNPYPLYPSNLDNIIDTGIDVGSYATPQLIDLNRDGFLDLVIGERSGIDEGILNGINYFENSGLNNQIPIFEEATPELTTSDGVTIKSLGGINLMDQVFTTAYTTPHVFEYENEYHLAVGSECGKVFLYNNIENDLFGFYNFYTNTDVIGGNILPNVNCIHSSVAINDINNDEQPDLIRGNASGGLELFLGNEFNVQNTEEVIDKRFNIFPNPNSGYFTIEHNQNTELLIEVYSITGKLLSSKIINQQNININLEDKTPGIYILQIKNNQQIIKTKKLIINN